MPSSKKITKPEWGSGNLAKLAIEIVKAKLSEHGNRRNARAANDGVPSLFDLSVRSLVQTIGGDDTESTKALVALPQSILMRAVMGLHNISYHLFCAVAKANCDENDLDEWILSNETWLRDTLGPEHANQSGTEETPWSHGLVQLSAHADAVFPSSVVTSTCRTITRPTSLAGFKILDGRRPSVLRIQASVTEYAAAFDIMTHGLLRGLSWDNVFVAGGIVLGTLLCTTDEAATNEPKEWQCSDVDIYIYGLGPAEANMKIEHIFSVFKANLPDDAPVLVVRNMKTISFLSRYPLRRIEIVLKLVASPRDVLLNFDLDICAMGWDGKEVWMLPRAARAIETGYTIFTMDLINGHYLGYRRATQDERVFKYAKKGYGIRILPRYLDELRRIIEDPAALSCQGIKSDADHVLDIEYIAQKARKYTYRAIETTILLPLSETLKPLPRMSHRWLNSLIFYKHTAKDPVGMSCLSGLELFMRHVALWEHEVAGEIVIPNDIWAAPEYDTTYELDSEGDTLGYSDCPEYIWDEHFVVPDFIPRIQRTNDAERKRVLKHIQQSTISANSSFLPRNMRTQRMSHATSIQDILQEDCDIYFPVWLPAGFAAYVENIVPTAVRATGNSYTAAVFQRHPKFPSLLGQSRLQLVIWHVTKVTMWQQLSRAIDEISDVIWSFHRANSTSGLTEHNIRVILGTQFRKRAFRETARDESNAFVQWVANSFKPPRRRCSGWKGWKGWNSSEDRE